MAKPLPELVRAPGWRGGALALLLAASQAGAAGELYRWRDADGRLHISSEPPAGEMEVRVQTYTDPPAVSRAPADAKQLPTVQPGAFPRVIMYSTDWCSVCKRAKRYLRSRKIPFREYDVEKSARGAAEYRRLGGRGVPLILVGEYRMDGFGEARFAELLKRARPR